MKSTYFITNIFGKQYYINNKLLLNLNYIDFGFFKRYYIFSNIILLKKLNFFDLGTPLLIKIKFLLSYLKIIKNKKTISLKFKPKKKFIKTKGNIFCNSELYLTNKLLN